MDGLPAGDFTESGASGDAPFAGQFVTLSRQEHVQLVWEGRYWKSLHPQGAQRLSRLECEYRERLRAQVESAARREQALQQELEYARGRIRDLEKRLFGGKSERRWAIDNQQRRGATGLRKRGQQPGARGHGRRRLSELPVCEEIVALTSPCRPKCGKRLTKFPGTEDSEVLEIEVKAYRRRIHRRRYRPSCRCAVLPGIVAAPAPGRLIERGKWGVSLWVQALWEKFLYGHSSGRWIEQLGDLGVELSAGTLCGGLRAIAPLFVPLYQALLPRGCVPSGTGMPMRPAGRCSSSAKARPGTAGGCGSFSPARSFTT